MGLPPVKHAVFREEVRVIHDLLRDGEATYNTEGMSKKIRYIHRDRRFISLDGPIPFYVAANGPKTIALAGEFGDGCVTTGVINPDRVEAVKKHLAGGRRTGEAQAAGQVPHRHADARMRIATRRGPRFAAREDHVRAVGDGESACLRGWLCARRITARAGAPGLPGLHGLRLEDEDAARRALPRTPSRALLLCGTGGVEVRHAGIDRMLHHRGAARESRRADSRAWRRPGYRRFSSIHRWTDSAIASARSRARFSSESDLTPNPFLRARGIRRGS